VKGIFAIAQHTDRVLKLARHASGYLNPTAVTDAATGTTRTVSTPRTAVTDAGLEAPAEARAALSAALSSLVPQFAGKQLSSTRLCCICPFPLPLLSAPRLLLTHSATGDFIVTHHPTKAGLFLATGGSGHAFKFLPVIGGHIADILERKTSARFASKWAWPREAASVVTRDGSRGDGGVQLVLEVAAGTAAG